MGEPKTPPPAAGRIAALLDRLSRRERALLGVQAVAAGLSGPGLGLLAGALLLSVGAPRVAVAVAALAATLAGLGLAGWLLFGRPGQRSRAAVHQARRVEALRPALRGSLLAAVAHEALLGEPAKPAPRGVSRVLVQRAARRAAGLLEGVPPAEVHPPRRAGWSAGAAAFVGLCLFVADRALPVGPFDALSVALGGSAAEARLDRAADAVSDERAIVGDIVLRYVFPDYTGIDPIEVPNSDGTIHAPPGTTVQITARTAEAFDAAALQVGEATPVDAALTGGRDLATQLVVESAGTWRFVLFSGGEVVLSPDYRIEVEDDAPPVVALQGSPPPVAARDRRVPIAWSVQDDFGVERVVLEVERADGTIEEHALRTPLDAPRQLGGGVPLTPGQLGIPAGETVTMRVVAYDNDRLEGSKRGVSPDVEVEVIGPQGQGARLTAHYQRLRDALLPALAGFLTDEMLPAASSKGMTRWVQDARDRLTPARTVQEEQWQGADATGLDAVLLGEVMDSSARLFRFTLTTWEPGSNRRVTESDVTAFMDLHAETIEDLERAIITLDELLQRAAKGELARELEDLAQQAQQLAAMAEDAEAGEILARLDQLERMMQRFGMLAQKLAEGSLQEFLNPRMSEAQNLVEQIRQAVAEGRLDDAREMLQQLAEQLQQMSETMNTRMAQQQQGDDQLGEQFDQTMEELAELEQQQDELADRLQQAREEMGGGVDDLMELWARVDALAEQARARSVEVVENVGDGAGWRLDSLRWFERLQQRTAGIQDAVRARNAAGALDRVQARDTAQALGMSRRLLDAEADRRRPPGEPVPSTVGASMEAVSDVDRTLGEMVELLQQLLDQQQEESPEVQQAARDLSAQQEQLRQRAQQVGQDVQRIEQAMPTADGTGSDAMQAADRAMERAGEAMGEGEAMAGEGHGRDAARRLREAQDALNREMQRHQQMQQAMQRMQGEQEPDPGDGEEDQQQQRDRPFELPAPEAFQTPEEYRRRLLQGMEGDVPDEYEALKQRYYEELVRQ